MTERITARVTSFESEGFRLVGTIHEPCSEIGRSPVGLVIPNQGPVDRAGAHRASVSLARHFANHGFPVFRFDARGIGESEGEWTLPHEGAPIRMLYRLIEEGAWTADALSAIDHFLSETGCRAVVLLGLCGGAATALHAASHSFVAGIAAVGVPVRVQADLRGPADLVDEALKLESRRYLGKMCSIGAWKRLATGKTDYRTLLAVTAARLARIVRGRVREAPKLNAVLVRSFEKATDRRVPILLAYSERDYLWTEFQSLFLPMYPPTSYGYQVTTIPNADHTLSTPESLQALATTVMEWLPRVCRQGGAL